MWRWKCWDRANSKCIYIICLCINDYECILILEVRYVKCSKIRYLHAQTSHELLEMAGVTHFLLVKGQYHRAPPKFYLHSGWRSDLKGRRNDRVIPTAHGPFLLKQSAWHCFRSPQIILNTWGSDIQVESYSPSNQLSRLTNWPHAEHCGIGIGWNFANKKVASIHQQCQHPNDVRAAENLKWGSRMLVANLGSQCSTASAIMNAIILSTEGQNIAKSV